jgi:hypothetical protein
VEHIVPYAAGGSDAFVTNDVSMSGNSGPAARADASFVDNLYMQEERRRRRIASRSGRVPSLSIPCDVEIAGRAAKADYHVHPDGSREIITRPEVQWRPNGVTVHCHPREFATIAAKVVGRAPKHGIEFERLASLPVPDHVRVEGPRIEPRPPQYSPDMLALGYLKMALGTGHHVLGPGWSRGPSADRLRDCLLSEQPIDWGRHSLAGAVWPNCDASWVDEVSAGPDCNVLFVKRERGSIWFGALFFGRFDAEVVLHEGSLSDCVLAEDGLWMIVIDSRTRTTLEEIQPTEA